MVAPDGIEHVARFLAANPDGVMGGHPGVTNFDFRDLINQCQVFHEMTGDIGDVSEQEHSQSDHYRFDPIFTFAGRPDSPADVTLGFAQQSSYPSNHHQPTRVIARTVQLQAFQSRRLQSSRTQDDQSAGFHS